MTSNRLHIRSAVMALPLILFCSGVASTQTTGSEVQEPSWQTAAGGKMEFEVASIHLAEPGKFETPTFGLGIDDVAIPPGGHLKADFPLSTYIEFAYKLLLTPEQRDAMLAGLPSWAHSQSFVIDAKAPSSDATKDQMRLMMQSLLANRFKLALHFETREVPVLAVDLARPPKLGPRVRPHAEGLSCNATWTAPSDPVTAPPGAFVPRCRTVLVTFRADHTLLLGARDTSMGHFVLYLPSLYKFGRPLVDRTSLTGTFDFSLNWTPDPGTSPFTELGDTSNAGAPSFVAALKDQLGLKLSSTRAAIQVPVIDHLELPSPN